MHAGPDHQTRVCAVLSQEFGDRLEARIIERVAAEEVAAFDGARIQHFVPILATRLGRRRLSRLGVHTEGGGGGGLDGLNGFRSTLQYDREGA
jgi:hypothetical protein